MNFFSKTLRNKWVRNIFGVSNSVEPVYLCRICCSALSARPCCVGTAVLISQAFQFTHSPQWVLYTKSPFIVAMLSSTLSPSFASLAFLTLPFCSQANKRLSVSFLKILLCNQLVDKHPPSPGRTHPHPPSTRPNCFPWLLVLPGCYLPPSLGQSQC